MSAHPAAVDPAHADPRMGPTPGTAPPRDRLSRGVGDICALLRRALRWWTGELASLLPAGLRQRLTAPRARLVVIIDGTASLLLERGGASEPLGRFSLDAGRDPALAVRALARRRGLASALAAGTLPVCLRLSADKALRTTISLPLAAESNLDEVVSFELDRHTPFTAEQVYFSARAARRDEAAQRIEVELTLVPRAVAAEALQVAERLGLHVDRIDVAGADGAAGASGNLLPQSHALASRRRAGRVPLALAAVAAVLAVVAVALPLARLRHEAATTNSRFAAIRAAAVLERQVDELQKRRLFIVDRKRATIPVSTVLLDLTRILPDDTWLTTMQISGDEIQLGGTTRSAAAVIGLLERSRKFKDTTFRTPVTQDPVTGRETFYIVARIVPEPGP